jgi:hypothetical protein
VRRRPALEDAEDLPLAGLPDGALPLRARVFVTLPDGGAHGYGPGSRARKARSSAR